MTRDTPTPTAAFLVLGVGRTGREGMAQDFARNESDTRAVSCASRLGGCGDYQVGARREIERELEQIAPAMDVSPSLG